MDCSDSIYHQIPDLYQRLRKALGPSHWWPAESPFEVMVGAVLTQNTSWQNVEKALSQLKAKGLLSAQAMQRADEQELAELIRSSGYYRQKAKKLKALLSWFSKYNFSVKKIQKKFPAEKRHSRLRKELLEIYGVGPETADSILCYALGYPYFVVDAYTKRLWRRFGLSKDEPSYEALQEEVHSAFEAYKSKNFSSAKRLILHYNEFHALIVRHGNSICKKRNPLCRDCPLQEDCSHCKMQKPGSI